MAQPSKSNDFLEILMLTGFFCTVFFGCFGGYYWWQKETALEARETEQSNSKDLYNLLRASKSRDAKIRNERVKESQRDAVSMRAAVDEVLRKMGANRPVMDTFKPQGRAGTSKSKVREEEVQLVFEKGSGLRAHLGFLERLEGQKPHIKMKRVRLQRTRRRRDDTNPDQWDSTLNLVTYVSEADKKPKPKSE